MIAHKSFDSPRDPIARKTLPRPPHPAPTSVTIAKRPSVWDGMARLIEMFLPTTEAKYFCKEGWTPLSTNRPTGKSVDCGESKFRSCPGWKSVRHSGARSCASPESITTIGSMDSGLALRAPRNDTGVCGRRSLMRRAAQHPGNYGLGRSTKYAISINATDG